ncbi:hypothetical protein [Methanobacterium petrolearium]|uniref:hypothetical protein n=1 Tax=Methanobacterium petrolearium TaxID=710190 RepID=UPI003081F84C
MIFIVSILLFQNLGALGLAISYIISYSLNTLIFVPFYISRRVVPKNLLISWEVILIWLVLIIQTILALSHVNLWIRSLGLIIAIGIMVFSFYRILKPTNWRR